MENPLPDYQQLTQMWLEFVSKMASAAESTPVDSVPSEVAKQTREIFFQTLGRYTDQYMRSPEFLTMMKQSTDAAVTLRQQTNDLLAQAHHSMGGLARPDVDGVLKAIRRCETRILDKLDELSSRVDELEINPKSDEPAHGKPVRHSK
jgi:hypothetical protein